MTYVFNVNNSYLGKSLTQKVTTTTATPTMSPVLFTYLSSSSLRRHHTHMSLGADIENLGSIELIKDSKERDVYFVKGFITNGHI